MPLVLDPPNVSVLLWKHEVQGKWKLREALNSSTRTFESGYRGPSSSLSVVRLNGTNDAGGMGAIEVGNRP